MEKTILTIVRSWWLVLEMNCTKWKLQRTFIRLKYIILDEHKTIYWVANEDDFYKMCIIHNMYKKATMDTEVKEMDDTKAMS